MVAVPIPDEDETRDNRTFEAILWALSRPGEPRNLPRPGLLTVGLALIDRECAIFADEPALADALAQTGAAIAPIEAADHVFLHAPDSADEASLGRLAAGDQLYPDGGATVVATARLDQGQQLRLTGPGVAGERRVRIDLGDAFWRSRNGLCRYPQGIDLILVDGARLMGLPRSTHVEVI